jgi:hypothetical protein
MSGLWIGARKIVRHPRDFWWIDYALNNHVWIVRRWLYERASGLCRLRPDRAPTEIRALRVWDL